MQISLSVYTLLLRLVAAHVIADFLFRRRFMGKERGGIVWKSNRLYVYSLFAAVLAYAFSWTWRAVWLPFAIFIAHVVIEGWRERKVETCISLVLSQFIYLLILIFCWLWLSNIEWRQLVIFAKAILMKNRLWIIGIAYMVTIWPMGILIGRITEPWRNKIDNAALLGLENAGMRIGQLERILILTFVLLGHYEVIGFLIAAKSILRFGEVSKKSASQAAEYVLFGTMVSFTAAIMVGLLAVWLLKKIG